MLDETLRFFARGTALVSDFDAMDRGIRRYIGRKYAEAPGKPGRFAFVSLTEPEAVPFRHEYAKACADGELWPADEKTARLVAEATSRDVRFDASFGGEIPSLAKTKAASSGGKETA